MSTLKILIESAVLESVEDYGMAHRPSKTSPLHDLTIGGIIPDDIYTHPQHYAQMSLKTYQQSMAAIMRFRGKPSAKVTIYRASPRKMLNNGDWISLSKAYAEQESQSEETPVHAFSVKVKDVWFAGDDVNEFGYWGPNIPEDQDWLHDQLAQEKKEILKTGRIPKNPTLRRQFNKSDHFGKYGTDQKGGASSYYDYIHQVMSGDVKI